VAHRPLAPPWLRLLPPALPSAMPTTTDDKTTPKRKRAKGGPKAGQAKGATIIHVQFGNGGGRRGAPASSGDASAGQGAETPRLAADSPPDSREPVTDVFSPREVEKLLGLTSGRLRSLDRAHIVSPTGSKRGKRAYTFQDLIALRATHGLLANRVKIRDVAKAIGALRTSLPRVTRPLQELRIVSDGQRMVVRAEDGVFDPLTGQLVLDFQVNALRQDVVRLLRPNAGSGARTAYELYTRASTLDEDPSTFDDAEALYRRAIQLDPSLAIAYTNLGNIRFRRGDDPGAEALYAEALGVDPKQPEAHYNIGYVALERGDPERAIPHFEKAIAVDPRFADAHFNLAMALEQVDASARARPHWKRYLELEPRGTWAEVARQHL
jgi:DNA-binding transcriptional MerR regulator